MKLASYRCPEYRNDGTKRDIVLSGKPVGITGGDRAAVIVVDPDVETEPYRVLLHEVPRLGETEVPGAHDGWTVLGLVEVGGRPHAVVTRPAFERKADGRADEPTYVGVASIPPAEMALMGGGVSELLHALFVPGTVMRLSNDVLFADVHTIAARLAELGWVRRG